MARIFGSIDGIKYGAIFLNRQALHDAGVHAPLQAGISGSGQEGADSIVISGGYLDDEDFGDIIIYTGHGGRSGSTKAQTEDQVLERGNLALAKSCIDGLPVRVIRGASPSSKFAPDSGYRYDGLYKVDAYWSEHGREGFLVWRFRLIAMDAFIRPIHANTDKAPVARQSIMVQRLIRSSKHAQYIKELYSHICQACGIHLQVPGGHYAEGAHIRPLGQPHNGPDEIENILCLCPNDHTLLDLGALYIDDDWNVINRHGKTKPRKLSIKAEHNINAEHIRYQRQLYEEN